MECAQLEITGGGNTSPETVSFPGAYAGSNPGITINIYQNLSNYTIPGMCGSSLSFTKRLTFDGRSGRFHVLSSIVCFIASLS